MKSFATFEDLVKYDKTRAHWHNIKSRCFNPNNKAYKHYGGWGITMESQNVQ